MHPPATRIAGTSAAVGALLVTPALLFMSASILKYELGVPLLYDGIEPLLRRLDSPIILLGGLLGAAALNLTAVTRLSLRREGDEVVGIVAVRTRPWNLIVLGLSGFLLAGLLGYAFLENFVAR